MSRHPKKQIPTQSSSEGLIQSPFGSLDIDSSNLTPSRPDPIKENKAPKKNKSAFKGRIDLKRVKAGRAGKTVTVISGEAFTSQPEEKVKGLAKELKQTLGVGGSAKGKTIEIQGDQRDAIEQYLKKLGLRVVLSGG